MLDDAAMVTEGRSLESIGYRALEAAQDEFNSVRLPRMLEELEVLRIVSERLEAARLPFMLTGSFAMAYYGKPRMTRDLDKVDLIVRKGSEYRQVEFARRQPVQMHGVKSWIVSREDLILSKLVWAKDSGSELQRRDVRSLLDESWIARTCSPGPPDWV